MRESVFNKPGVSRLTDPFPSWASPPPGSLSQRRASDFAPAAGHGLHEESVAVIPLDRYELPPEFPLASPCSGIDHHLSGPNRYAITQIFRKRTIGR